MGAIPVTWSRELPSAPRSVPHCKPTATSNQQKARLLRVMLEDLNVAGMAKNHKLDRATADAGWRLPRISSSVLASGSEAGTPVIHGGEEVNTAQTSQPGASLC